MKRKSVLVAAAAAAALPVLAAAPAGAAPSDAATFAAAAPSTASYTMGHCTVTAQDPFKSGETSTGRSVAAFRITFKCDPGRSLKMIQEGYEKDSTSNQKLFTRQEGPVSLTSGQWTRTISVYYWDGAGDPIVELYHRVRFQVSAGGVTSAQTPWIYSRTVNFVV